ncbi:hypothetical protein [Hydrogenophaga sp. 2FB]|uniref:hypothetical protein n=1 Tax=Hydrogenophaga sp. 2FB TaxID=2502187 RepID=UPI0010F5FFE4|nr:hypothetical protein [Hydrogenophaga sp. 2FB]
MTKPAPEKLPSLPPDPVEASSGRVGVTAWVDKDGWIERKTPVPGHPLSFFVVLSLDRGAGEAPAEFDLNSMTVEDIESLSASLSQVAAQLRRPA